MDRNQHTDRIVLLAALAATRRIWTPLTVLVLAALAVNLKYDLGFSRLSNVSVSLNSGYLSISIASRGQGWYVPNGIGVRTDTMAFPIRGSYGIYAYPGRLWIYFAVPAFWLLFPCVGLGWLSGKCYRWDRIRRGLCSICGYDLRGSPSGGCCSECGTDFEGQQRYTESWVFAKPSYGWLLAGYVGSAVLWTLLMPFHHYVPWVWLPRQGSVSSFASQMSGPFVWAVEALRSFVYGFDAWEVATTVSVAVAAWGVLAWILARPYFQSLPVLAHVPIFILWVCAGNALSGSILFVLCT